MNVKNDTVTFLLITILIFLTGCGGDNGSPDPEITGIQPESGPPGTAVTISGSGFSPEDPENTVTFDGIEAPIHSATTSEIETEVPEDAETGPIAVTVGENTATGPNFTIEATAPGISSVEPDSGVVGTQVTIKGMNFSPTTTDNTITFNGTEAPIIGAAQDQLVTEVPEGATDGPLEVTVNDKSTTGPDFDVITEGTLAAIISTSGPDQDENGYNLVIDGTMELSSDTSDTVYAGGLAEENHTAELMDVAANCAVESDNPQMADVVAGDTTTVSFDVGCKSMLKNRIVFMSDRGAGGQIDLYTMDPDGSNIDQLTNDSDIQRFPDVSPDGTRIAYAQGPDGGRNIWVINADGTDPVQLTTSGKDGVPVWSPDGSQILYTSSSDGDGDIYVMNANGSSQTNITNNTDGDFGASWSPDGTQIVFTSDRDGDPEIFVSNADGTSPQQLTDNSDFDTNPAWSPDGNKIGFFTDRGSGDQLYTMDTDGSNQQPVAEASSIDSFVASWSPDGSQIVFHSNHEGDFEIYRINADGTSQTNITMQTTTDIEPDWSPME